jgi:hypothetical protein
VSDVQVLGWTVDADPCNQCREVQYGVRIYVMTADGEITSVWFCGETSAVRDWMQRAMHLSST